MSSDEMKKGNGSSNNIKRENGSMYTYITRYLPTYKLLAIIGWSLLFLDIILRHNKSNSTTLHIKPPPADRSSLYHVKVLPNMDDIELDTLPSSTFSYMAMIDAGSSGCRAHVYRYGKVKTQEGPLYILPKHLSLKVRPGLSTFANNPMNAGESLKGLIDFMKTQVPESDWGSTPIWLKATAGLRIIDPDVSEAILNSIRVFLSESSNSPFLFRSTWAKVIPGVEEGAFGWISYNYLKQIIGPKRSSNTQEILPFAVVEMGGASTQVTQIAPSDKEASSIPDSFKYTFTIEGQSYSLYTHSYLGYGAEQARQSFNKYISTTTTPGSDPCLNKGYERNGKAGAVYEGPDDVIVKGVSDSSSCMTGMKTLFPSSCTNPNTILAKPLSFGCIYQPNFIQESMNFLVFENFFYTASGIDIEPTGEVHSPTSVAAFPRVTTLSDIQASARNVCAKNWSELTAEYPKDGTGKENNVKFCFTASFMSAFLSDGLHIPPNKLITIQQQVGTSDIEWALGAAYKEAADFLRKDSLRGSIS